MRITKNRKLDVGYVLFRKGKVARTVEVMPGVLFDLDRKGQILGIEVLSLKKLAPALKSEKKTGTLKKAA